MIVNKNNVLKHHITDKKSRKRQINSIGDQREKIDVRKTLYYQFGNIFCKMNRRSVCGNNIYIKVAIKYIKT